MALCAGRRFSLLIAEVMVIAATIGAALCKDYAGHMIARVF